MTAHLRELADEAVRTAKAYCLEPNELSLSLLKLALAKHDKASKEPHAHCLESCKSVGRECGMHKVCRRA